jgi:hypothetical protein
MRIILQEIENSKKECVIEVVEHLFYEDPEIGVQLKLTYDECTEFAILLSYDELKEALRILKSKL